MNDSQHPLERYMASPAGQDASIQKGFAISGTEATGRDLDPDVDRMLATHVHCGKTMRVVTADETPLVPGADPSTTALERSKEKPQVHW